MLPFSSFLPRPPAHPVVFDGNALDSLLAKLMDGHVSYEGNAKCGDPSSKQPEDIKKLDCSGLIEYLFYWITNPHVDISSGSSHQEDWFSQRYPWVKYQDAGRCDGMLRIAFRHRGRNPHRHVWFILNGRTIESTPKGPGSGPTRFGWHDRVSEAHSCFLLGTVYPLRFT
jgi:hypothetical protein